MEDLLNGNLPIEKPLSSLEAISDQALYESYIKIKRFEIEQSTYDIHHLPQQAHSRVVEAVGDLLEEIVGNKIDGDTKPKEIDEYATDLGIRVSKLEDKDNPAKGNVEFCTMVRVTLIAKILNNIEFAGENIRNNPDLLKQSYQGRYTEDLVYIWLTSLKNKRKQEE